MCAEGVRQLEREENHKRDGRVKTLDEIKKTMAGGDTAKAAEALKELLEKDPQNLQAKMLYGTCCQLLGDEGTFRRIHDELAPAMAGKKKGVQPEVDSRWTTYHRAFVELAQDSLTRKLAAENEDIGELYGCIRYDPVEHEKFVEVFDRLKAERNARRRRRQVLLLLIPTLLLLWLAWWLGQRI